MKTTILLPLVLLTIAGTKTQAQTYVGTIVAKKGEVKICVLRQKTLLDPLPFLMDKNLAMKKERSERKCAPEKSFKQAPMAKLKLHTQMEIIFYWVPEHL